jgi:cytochrome b pre-mRNA-processing protein 6
VHFQEVMQARVNKLQSPAATASNVKSNAALATPVEPFSEEKEMKQISALDALLGNKFENAFPIPPQVRRPRYNATHYDDIVKELEEAPNRSFFTNFWNRLKGSVRLR